MRLQLTDSAVETFDAAGEEPFRSINQANGISVDSFLSLLKVIVDFIPEFEAAIGMQGARAWIGERLHEAVHACRATVEQHLHHQYFSEFEIQTDTAYILIENYELAKVAVGLLRRRYHAYDLTVLRFLLTRSVHEDTHAHLHKTVYSALFSELVDQTRRRIEEKRPSARIKIKKLPLELTAPIYLKEKEELTARRLQRFALNAFLKAFYEQDPEAYGLLGVPLFLPPHPAIIGELRRLTKREVDFQSGFMSRYRAILREYAAAITPGDAEIYSDARLYLHAKTDYLIHQVQKCLNGDYSDLRTTEREVVWRPGRELRI
ncbi:MAG: hypothetical protein EFT35_09560 [Methanophagales archaeon ANME-1-THS]|nr:MAG: hypothetical protein EFT35_09560 [Methanophagales archaeon ANME-1-THS]